MPCEWSVIVNRELGGAWQITVVTYRNVILRYYFDVTINITTWKNEDIRASDRQLNLEHCYTN